MTNFLSIFGYLVAAVALGFGFVQWKKLAQMQNILLESMNRNLALKTSSDHARNAQKNVEDQISNNKQLIAKLEKNLLHARSEVDQLKEKLTQTDAVNKVDIEAKDRLIEKFSSEAKVLTRQLIELDAEQGQMKKKLREELEATLGGNTKEYKQLESQFKELQQNYKEATLSLKTEKEKVSKMESMIAAINPAEYNKTRRKIKQYSQIFTVMRGQKEMAEERAQNWETGLKLTSTWIIKKMKPQAKIPSSSAQIATMALELINEQLVDDSTAEDVQGAQSLEDMLATTPMLDLAMTPNTTTSQPMPTQV